MNTRPAPTRERLLRAAIDLFQTQGYHATGVAQILERAQAPKGSLYHHFPGGKEALGVEAVSFIGGEIVALLARRRASGARASALILDLARGMSEWLARSGWRQGVLLSSLAHETVLSNPKLHRALAAAFDAWRGSLARALKEDGVADASELAGVAVAALSGGLMLARIDQSAEPLIAVGERLARLAESARG